MDQTSSERSLVARHFGQNNLDRAHSEMRSDFGLHTRPSMSLIATVLVALLPLVARTEEATSTYGQRIVAAVLMGEARGEGAIGMTAVAEVISNRAKKTSKSPLAIVLKKGQFSCLKDISPEELYRKVSSLEQYPVALRIAKTCYNTPEQLPNVTSGATFFDHITNRPPWLGAMQSVTNIGKHRFYVPNKCRTSRSLMPESGRE